MCIVKEHPESMTSQELKKIVEEIKKVGEESK